MTTNVFGTSTVLRIPTFLKPTAEESKLHDAQPTLKHKFDKVSRAWHQLQDAQKAEEETRANRAEKYKTDSASVKSHNDRLDAEEKAARQAHDLKINAVKAEFKAAKAEYRKARTKAMECAALAGIPFEESRVETGHSAPRIMAHVPFGRKLLSMAATLFQSGLRAPSSSITMPPIMGVTTTLAAGATIGISVGLVSRILQYDTLARHPLELFLFLCIGMASALSSQFAIVIAWHLAGRHDIIEQPGRFARPVTKAIALAVSSFIVLADGAVEQAGLLSAKMTDPLLQGVSGFAQKTQPTSSFLFLLMGILIIGAFTVYHSFSGFVKGQADGQIEKEAANKQRPHVDPQLQAQKEQIAQAALGAAKISKEGCNDLEAEVAEKEREGEAECRAIRSQKLPPPIPPSDESGSRQIPEEIEFQNAQADYYRLLSDCKHAAAIGA